jgi:hypothetical protein
MMGWKSAPKEEGEAAGERSRGICGRMEGA